MEESYLDQISHSGDSPRMVAIKRAFDDDLNGNTGFYERMEDNYKQRRNLWATKTPDLRKNDPDARPWQFASDNEAWVIDPRIDAKVAICWNAWVNGDVSAIPTGSDDLERSASVTNFVRYMMNSWVKNPHRQFNLASNYMFEKTFAATYVGWRKLKQKLKERLDLDDFAKINPQIAELFADEDKEDEVLQILQQNFEFVNEKIARRALKQLRKNGVADLPIAAMSIDEPVISTLSPDSEVFFPPYTIDPEMADRCHVVSFMSQADLISTASAEEWNQDVLDDILENYMGVTQNDVDGQFSTDGFRSRGVSTTFHVENPDTEELAFIVRTLIRKVDPEDGSLGIYEVIWCPRQGQDDDDQKFLLFDLINGLDVLPVAVTTYKDDAKRLFEGRSDCESLRGIQRNVKVLSDLGIDNANIAMDPPRHYPMGGNLHRWGSGVSVAIRRGTRDDYGAFDVPNMMPQTGKMNEYYDKLADDVVGLDQENPNSVARLQYSTSRVLLHWSKVTKLAWKMYKLYGPEERIFRITGDPTVAPQTFQKGSTFEDIDVSVQYDVRLNNPEYRDKVTENTIKLLQADTEGAGDRREAMNVLYAINLPQFAPRILRAAEESRADILDKVSKDLALIKSGQSVPAQPAGAKVALDYIVQWAQQEDILAELEANPLFEQRLQIYVEQYQFQLTQQENAGIGARGTEATMLEGISNAQ
jgi:hypothetical protein